MKQPSKAKAIRETGKLSRPEGLTAHQWRNVRDLLFAIAAHYPLAYPGEARLAEALEVSVRTIKRYLAMAVRTGLVEVIPGSGRNRGGHGHFRTNTYRLWYLHQGTELSPRRGARSGPQSSTYSVGTPKKVQNPSDSELEGGERAAPPAQPKDPLAKVIPLRPSQGADVVIPTEDVGTGVFDPEPEGKTVTVRHPYSKAARELVRYFEDRWAEAVTAQPRLAEVKCAEVGAATGYVKTTFLQPARGAPRTEAEVRAMIDGFMRALGMRKVRIRPGQSAWQCFTGWWGKKGTTRGGVDYAAADERYRRKP